MNSENLPKVVWVSKDEQYRIIIDIDDKECTPQIIIERSSRDAMGGHQWFGHYWPETINPEWMRVLKQAFLDKCGITT